MDDDGQEARGTALATGDAVLATIADYVVAPLGGADAALRMAGWDFMDAMAVAMAALDDPECWKLVGPFWSDGAGATAGVRLVGTRYRLNPAEAAFALGSMIRWLDFNDAFLGREWGHPSDNLGAILPAAEWATAARRARGREPLVMRDVLEAMVRAHEIQGALTLDNSLNAVGIDHVAFVKLASTAVVTHLWGGDRTAVLHALSQAVADGGTLRVYRHGPATGWRKSWAAGDAASRAVWLAALTLRGERGYPEAVAMPRWGFQDVVLRGSPLRLERPLGHDVMEHVLFKVPYPSEYHGQTAIEAAVRLRPAVAERLEAVRRIRIRTQESAARIIDKRGPLDNPAARDHCLQYMVAVALLYGRVDAEHYRDPVAQDPRIDALRDKMVVEVDAGFTRDYLDPAKRSVANAIRVEFDDGSTTEEVVVEYPLGHPRRRAESREPLERKWRAGLGRRLPAARVDALFTLFDDWDRFCATPVDEIIDHLVP
ncbi:MAG: bifunctional 2-methylcitrate dehydratase/aconitate hydratase [Actinomycetia bacterium]|nr:bifunctional 2-methylcitrate dehydratase/aconitate hydratase [Actinomycetes bacterium]